MILEDFTEKLRARCKVFLYKIIFRNAFYSSWKQNKWGRNTRVSIEDSGHLSLGESIWLRDNIRIDCADRAVLKIGDRVFCNSGTYISARKKIIIGSDTIMGPNVMIFDHDHDFRNDLHGFVLGDIVIGSKVWIGANAVILKNTEIGDHSVIGAGCIAKGKIPPYSVVTGNGGMTVRLFIDK